MSDIDVVAACALPADFHAAAIMGMAGNRAIIAGYRQGGDTWDIHYRRASACLFAGGVFAPAYDGPGWIQAADHTGEVAWAVAATLKPGGEGSDYRLLASLDEGRSWEERGAIPVGSLARILAVGAREAWVLGAGVLARTVDGGASWAEVRAPGSRDPYRERLAVAGGRVLLLGAGILGTDDGGRTWDAWPVEGAAVHALQGTLVLATKNGSLRFGVVQDSGVDWLVTFPDVVSPFRLLVEGSAVRFLGRAGGSAGGGTVLCASQDLGATWTTHALSCLPGPENADLAPGGGWFAIDGSRHILVPGR